MISFKDTTNMGIGTNALANISTGTDNIAIGSTALTTNSAGSHNIAIGSNALTIYTGSDNTAIGHNVLTANTTGTTNTGVGFGALLKANTAFSNVAVGANALANLLTGQSNVAIGLNAGSAFTGAEQANISIGNLGVAGESAAIRIGVIGSQTKCFLAGINGVAIGKPSVSVLVNNAGQLGTTSSSRRFKTNIIDAKNYSDINKLRVVNFNYKEYPEDECVGLIAEEVESVMPELVVYNADGEVQSVKYLDLIPILLQQIQFLNQRILH